MVGMLLCIYHTFEHSIGGLELNSLLPVVQTGKILKVQNSPRSIRVQERKADQCVSD